MCSQCDFSATLKRNLERHVIGIHGSQERKFSCSICGKKYKSEVDVKVHEKRHTAEKKHVCNYCGKAFLNEKYLRSHVNIHEGKYEGHCVSCDKNFVQFVNYKLHMMKHHQIEVPQRTKQTKEQILQGRAYI